MRSIKYIVVHCSASRASADLGASEIRQWHMSVNGWRDIGYHYVIRRSGKVEAGRPLERVGAHVSGHNLNSIGVCLVGGIDGAGRAEDNFTPEQRVSLKNMLIELGKSFPGAEILGHRDFPGVKKDCPCFEVKTWLVKEDLA